MTYKEKTKELVANENFANLEKYVEMIEEKNKVMNLTGFSGDRLWQEGIYESIVLLIAGFGELKDKSILDIGAGAGFPSVPYLIAFPDNELTIYEPQTKRSIFLNEVKDELKLNIDIQIMRAEKSNEEEKYDFITARAVGSFKSLVEVSHKSGKVGAVYSFIKGPKAMEELMDAQKIIKIFEIHPVIVPVNTTDRKNNLMTYTKDVQTPAGYPREWNEIIK